jgi:hypothetical protein
MYQNHSVLSYTTLVFSSSDTGKPSLFHAAFSSTLKMEAAYFAKMVIPIHQLHIPGDHNLYELSVERTLNVKGSLLNI